MLVCLCVVYFAGADVSGEVVRVGPGVTTFVPGDKVVSCTGRVYSFSDFVGSAVYFQCDGKSICAACLKATCHLVQDNPNT